MTAKLRAPGWYRAALFSVLGFGFSVGITALLRSLQHIHPVMEHAVANEASQHRSAHVQEHP